MSNIYVIGDLHGNVRKEMKYLNTKNFPEQWSMTKNDVVIQLGDFGFFWDQEESKEERHWLNWLATRNYTFCFIDGNHENFERLEKLPEGYMFGNRIRYWDNGRGDKIYWLQRGLCYTINGQRMLALGGAQSTDKHARTIGISWWEQEIWSREEEERCLNTCEEHEYKFDYILSHTAPASVIIEMDKPQYYRAMDPTSKFFDHLLTERGLEFKAWHFGHMHQNWSHQSKFFCHYEHAPVKI